MKIKIHTNDQAESTFNPVIRKSPVHPPSAADHSTTPQLHHSNSHYWRTEPAPGVDPALARQRPSYAFQYVFCLSTTGQPVAITRKVPHEKYPRPYWGPIRTAWFGCGKIETKRHETLQGAKKFVERKFTRTPRQK
jgi:hypothetical protein